MQDSRPDLISVGLVISDRLNTPSAFLARARGCDVLELDYGSYSAPISANKSESFNDHLLKQLLRYEDSKKEQFDLAVLAYRRILTGTLFERFQGRAINQHPADLTVKDQDGNRKYVGIGGLARALKDEVSSTRTSTILVE
ncbi:hypothetical protein IB270_29395 [Ensifer sp. ENS05]|uniref:hypothetical protein n=1 Tax=Ensifer sp. ENS05 TaxID=2769277 RepID=UPI00177AA52D|nr:hypothetical protein [Ensifer sp. ENS05]MBD9596951.1 hypothetical protein [Ensifer sp. ENS05]